LPIIGKVLAEKLRFAGVELPHKLMAMGVKQAFEKVIIFNKGACINQLCAIAGAIKGICWHSLSKNKKVELL